MRFATSSPSTLPTCSDRRSRHTSACWVQAGEVAALTGGRSRRLAGHLDDLCAEVSKAASSRTAGQHHWRLEDAIRKRFWLTVSVGRCLRRSDSSGDVGLARRATNRSMLRLFPALLASLQVGSVLPARTRRCCLLTSAQRSSRSSRQAARSPPGQRQLLRQPEPQQASVCLDLRFRGRSAASGELVANSHALLAI